MLEKLAAIQMIDVELPTTDGRTVSWPAIPSRKTTTYLLQRLKLDLPAQPPPKITAPPPPPGRLNPHSL